MSCNVPTNDYIELAILYLSGTDRKTIILDCETTGLDPSKDEILQLAILSGEGDVLYNKLLRPARLSSWPEAEMIHHISPDMVSSAPTIAEELSAIQSIISSSELVLGYNTSFDIRFLQVAGIDIDHLWDKKHGCYWIEDLMELFAPIYGDWSEYHQSFTWKSLGVAAAHYGYTWPDGAAHDALADCRATLHVWKSMVEKGDIKSSLYKTYLKLMDG